MYWYQDFYEAHPAEGMSWVVAESLIQRLLRYENIRKYNKQQFVQNRSEKPLRDFMWPKGNQKFDPANYVKYTSITAADGKILKLSQESNSPILVVGDSFIVYPSMSKGGSIPSYLAYLMGIAPDILYRNGAGRAIPRFLALEGDKFLKHRSVCIFPFSYPTAMESLILPPIINLDKVENTLLALYEKDELIKLIKIPSGPGEHIFSFSIDGLLVVSPKNKRRDSLGIVSFDLPSEISKYKTFMLKIYFKSFDFEKILVKYVNQSDLMYRSPNQTTNDNFVIFESGDTITCELNFLGLNNTVPTEIEKIEVIGLK